MFKLLKSPLLSTKLLRCLEKFCIKMDKALDSEHLKSPRNPIYMTTQIHNSRK